MRYKILIFIIGFYFIVKYSDGYSQNIVSRDELKNIVFDSLSAKGLIYMKNREKPDIELSKDQALKYLQSKHKIYYWKNPDDPLRQAIGQLLFFASNNPFDSTRYFLDNYSYDSINIPWDKFYVWNKIKVKMPVILSSRFTLPVNTTVKIDTALKKNISDSIKSRFADTIPELQLKPRGSLVELKDTVIMVATDTLNEVTSSKSGFPFWYYNWPYESDSIVVAINTLISFVENRDSLEVNLKGSSNKVTPVWLNSKSERFVRFWIRNEYSDSVMVWVGSVSRNTLGLFLEKGILFLRPLRLSNFSDAKLKLKTINKESLMKLNNIPIKLKYWKFPSESAFAINQASLSNWVKGGESSISVAMDVTKHADYYDQEHRVFSNNFIRLKYGLVGSGKTPFRINLDLLETNSSLNQKAFGKFDLSAIMLIKTQIAKGYNYPNDSIPVSKFLNPIIFTIGLGLDYKPNKTTSLNFSPISYKITVVTDTAHINQTTYGIPHNRKSLHEPGVSILIANEFKPSNTIAITNRLQLFSNYIHNPQNIDIDWEMIATQKISWFADMRLNTNLIFDDDTKTVVFDKNNKPELRPDGTQKKTARIQFKELFGLSFTFKF
ncbi:MAG: DUF3078 domain-containing protein [Bacteroidales bacterium]